MMKKIFIVVLIANGLLLSGCGLNPTQQEGVIAFAQASEGLGDFTATTLSEMRASTIAMNVKNYEIRGSLRAAITQYRREVCKQDQQCARSFDADSILFEAFSLHAVSVRISAAKALSLYGQLLKALVKDTQAEEIQQASNRLVGSIKEVSKNAGTELDAQQLETLGIAINQLGKLAVEYKKERAIKEIVANTKDAVDTLCSLLIVDFTLLGAESDAERQKDRFGLVDGYSNTISRLRGSIRKALRNNQDRRSDALIMEAYSYLYENQSKLETVIHQANITLKKLQAANFELAQLMTDDNKQDINSIVALVEQFQQLRNAMILVGDW